MSPSSSADNRIFQSRDWLFTAILTATVFLVYQPAWRGGPLWDDNEHITRANLRSLHGLYRIWFDMGATAQYYPLLHTTFWLEHKIWGDFTLGYHLVKLGQHAAAAALLLAVLRRLALPGAYLAAAIFALHPVQVESVAWIAEQKNTLSAVFYLGAALLYLRFDEARRPKWYLAALGLFALALLTKTVTATLPGALLVIFWWRRGRVSWKRDVLPLLPYFLLGASLGVVSAWWELKMNRCFGPDFALTAAERVLLAGRTAWFCFGKLVWPVNLTFIYPRWHLDSNEARQYLYPLGALALLVGCWLVRRRWRGPLAAVLFFGGTLFPVLGFFNLYTFRYSFVADHYQYLACVGFFTLFSAAVDLGLRDAAAWRRIAGQIACVAILVLLGLLSWRQSESYSGVELLYRTTIARNPECWMAHSNLGNILLGRGETDAAVFHFEQAARIKPDNAETHYNLGLALAGRGDIAAAVTQFKAALHFNPNDAEAHNNLGAALARQGNCDEAIDHLRQALAIKPENAKAHKNLASLLASKGDLDGAITHYRDALALKPDYAEARQQLEAALARQKALRSRREPTGGTP